MSRIGRERPSSAEERALDCLVHGLAHVVATYGLEDGQKLAAEAVLLLGEVDDDAHSAPRGRVSVPVLVGANRFPSRPLPQRDEAESGWQPRIA
jgi:hypothetical protein